MKDFLMMILVRFAAIVFTLLVIAALAFALKSFPAWYSIVIFILLSVWLDFAE